MSRSAFTFAVPASLNEAWTLIRGLQVYAVVFIPRDATRAVERGESATVIAYYNASYPRPGRRHRVIAAVVQTVNASTSAARATYVPGRIGVRAAPVRVQSSILFNPARSYEHYLCGLLFPAILQLALSIAAVGALGRELRDGSAREWLEGSGRRLLPAVIGKLAPYLLLFTLYGLIGIVWIDYVRGDGIAGNLAVLMSGYALMHLAYAAVGLLLVGLTRNMGTALSLVGLYSGMALGFSGGTFPLIEGSLFSQVWSKLMPFTAYVKLQTQQIDLGAAVTASLWQLGTLVLFAVIAGASGLHIYGRAARDPLSWGRR